ncbi:MAG: tetratricopeptide repeat protein [Pirellulaceae bacterium]|nr:tetratricopeptide repeat protein [Pirellulaceae bacterium]
MKSLEGMLQTAMQHHQSGQLDVAEKWYREVLSVDPLHTGALHNLGVLASQSGRPKWAIELIEKAIATDSSQAELHVNLGWLLLNDSQFDAAIVGLQKGLQQHPSNSLLYEQLGNAFIAKEQWSEAAVAYEHVTQLSPEYVEGHNNLGNIYLALKRSDEAIECYKKSLLIAPEVAVTRHNLGNAYASQGNDLNAIEAFRRAVQSDPQHFETQCGLASALHRSGSFESAIEAYERALEIRPNQPEIFYFLGNLWVALKNYDSARGCYQKAIQLRPDYFDAHTNLAATYQETAQYDLALAAYDRLVQLRPDDPMTYCSAGNIFKLQGNYEAAIACYEKSIRLDPTLIDSHYHLGNVHLNIGNLDDAIRAFQSALRLNADHSESAFCLGSCYKEKRQHDRALEYYEKAGKLRPNSGLVLAAIVNERQSLCLWDDIDEMSDRVVQLLKQQSGCETGEIISPFTVISLCNESSPEEQRLAASERVRLQPSLASANRPVLYQQTPRRERSKIHIGYLSADFQTHPVGYLIPELIESHDRERFSVFGYSMGLDDGSSVRRRLVKGFDQFRDVWGSSFLQAAEMIRNDEIDILVDLQGYTTHSRPEIAALRPAPIQINYLGYPSSMGADFIDYILVDDYIVPLVQQPYFSEKLVYLPGCFMVNDSQREIDTKIPLRYRLGLPEDGFVFCAFNASYKITERIFEIWLRLLQATPKSVLWLRVGDPATIENLLAVAKKRGIASERLVMAPSVSMPKHLARHRAADLFLDTFPYNQHSTAGDALRMGLPMVTMSGQSFCSRVAGSLLQALDLDELITHSLDEYEALALRLAHNPDQLSAIRRKLAQNVRSSNLFDGRIFAKSLEMAYLRMWELHQSGDSPQPFVVPPSGG